MLMLHTFPMPLPASFSFSISLSFSSLLSLFQTFGIFVFILVNIFFSFIYMFLFFVFSISVHCKFEMSSTRDNDCFAGMKVEREDHILTQAQIDEKMIDEYFRFALGVVKKAGILVKHAFAQPTSQVSTKSSPTDLVTETDKAVEKLLIGKLTSRFPGHKFIGEESAAEGEAYEWTDAPTWIIDPIDGTTNFVHRIPFIAICVGLSVNKKLRAGIVYNPITDELFTAVHGKGALKNGLPISVSSTKALNQSVICQSLGQHNISEKGNQWVKCAFDNMRATLGKGVHGHRAFGSAAINMVYVAQGSIDAYVEYGLHSWDMAGAAVIVREAGGTLIDPTGSEFDLMSRKVLCAGTEELAREFSKALTHVDFKREA